jgi:membrane protease YdiL (CAAX protease family)
MLQSRIARKALTGLLLCAYLIMTYQGGVFALLSLLGSISILLIGRVLWPASWKHRLGLKFKMRSLLLAFVCIPPLILLFCAAVRSVAKSQDVFYLSPFQQYGFLDLKYLHTIGQTLNEEMILGALVLSSLHNRYPAIHLLWIAAFTAVVFSLLHYAFYSWMVGPDEVGRLTSGTLFTLLAIGLLRNALIIRAGHIAYAWSLHLAINLVGLWGLFRDGWGNELNEPEVFNLILGSPNLILLALFTLPVCVFLLVSAPTLRNLRSPAPPAGPDL